MLRPGFVRKNTIGPGARAEYFIDIDRERDFDRIDCSLFDVVKVCPDTSCRITQLDDNSGYW